MHEQRPVELHYAPAFVSFVLQRVDEGLHIALRDQPGDVLPQLRIARHFGVECLQEERHVARAQRSRQIGNQIHHLLRHVGGVAIGGQRNQEQYASRHVTSGSWR
jgi:hypothetical protein